MERVVDIIVAALLIVAAGVVCANVFSRYVLGVSLFGAEDFTILLLLWMTFVAAIVVQAADRHFSMPLLKEALSPAGQARLTLVVDVLSCVTLGILAVSSLTRCRNFIVTRPAFAASCSRCTNGAMIPGPVPHVIWKRGTELPCSVAR